MVNFKYKQNRYKIPPLMWERLKIHLTPATTTKYASIPVSSEDNTGTQCAT